MRSTHWCSGSCRGDLVCGAVSDGCASSDSGRAPKGPNGGRVSGGRGGGRGSVRDGCGRERPTVQMRLCETCLEAISVTSCGRRPLNSNCNGGGLNGCRLRAVRCPICLKRGQAICVRAARLNGVVGCGLLAISFVRVSSAVGGGDGPSPSRSSMIMLRVPVTTPLLGGGILRGLTRRRASLGRGLGSHSITVVSSLETRIVAKATRKQTSEGRSVVSVAVTITAIGRSPSPVFSSPTGHVTVRSSGAPLAVISTFPSSGVAGGCLGKASSTVSMKVCLRADGVTGFALFTTSCRFIGRVSITRFTPKIEVSRATLLGRHNSAITT